LIGTDGALVGIDVRLNGIDSGLVEIDGRLLGIDGGRAEIARGLPGIDQRWSGLGLSIQANPCDQDCCNQCSDFIFHKFSNSIVARYRGDDVGGIGPPVGASGAVLLTGGVLLTGAVGATGAVGGTGAVLSTGGVD